MLPHLATPAGRRAVLSGAAGVALVLAAALAVRAQRTERATGP